MAEWFIHIVQIQRRRKEREDQKGEKKEQERQEWKGKNVEHLHKFITISLTLC